MDVANEIDQFKFPWPYKLARLHRSIDRLCVGGLFAAMRHCESPYTAGRVAETVCSRISMSKNEPISYKQERLVPQQTEHLWVPASDSIKAMRWWIKGPRVI